MHPWDPQSPIYQQLADRLAAGLLQGQWPEGQPMASVRALATQHLLNPLTVSRALQQLSDQGLLEHRRGLGLFVVAGAQARLRQHLREQFLDSEWPRLRERLRRLDIGAEQLDWTTPA